MYSKRKLKTNTNQIKYCMIMVYEKDTNELVYTIRNNTLMAKCQLNYGPFTNLIGKQKIIYGDAYAVLFDSNFNGKIVFWLWNLYEVCR